MRWEAESATPWQVVKAGREFRFIPPDRVAMRRARGPGVRWAA